MLAFLFIKVMLDKFFILTWLNCWTVMDWNETELKKNQTLDSFLMY